MLYRSNDHEERLNLSKKLIESNAPLNEIEKAYLGRDAAISAEKLGDYLTARQYYLYGSSAANTSSLPNMRAMRVGLLADAALASWHNGDKDVCLKDYITVLSELKQFTPDQTLCTAHCHALARHVLLWLQQAITGETYTLEDGSEVVIYPGCVSNPEPSPGIKDFVSTPIEMAWYMLAGIENYAALDVGITKNIDQFLPNGPVLEGQMQLSAAKLHKAMDCHDIDLFIQGLTETISWLVFLKTNEIHSGDLDPAKVLYGTFPLATNEQQEMFKDLSEQYVLLYFSMRILKEDVLSIPDARQKLTHANGFLVRVNILDCLQKRCKAVDFNTSFACQIFDHATCAVEGRKISPVQLFELAFSIIQVAKITRHLRLFAESLLPWLLKKWEYASQHQRFLLKSYPLHEAKIDTIINANDASDQVKCVNILSAILPTIGLPNEQKRQNVLSDI